MRKTISIFSIIVLSATLVGCGRDISRMLGKDHRQVIQIEDMEDFISISFDKRGSNTVKDITYLSEDGYVYTREYKDASLLEGTIRWVHPGENVSAVRSREISRWTGGAVNLELPDDCAEILGVDIGYFSEDERVKNLTYLSADGTIYSREYKDGIIDRKFVGWLEIKKKD